MLASTCVKTVVLSAAAFVASVNAHANMILPEPTWPDGFYSRNSPSGLIDGNKALTVPTGKSFSTDPASNTAAFTEAFKASEYKSLKDLIHATETLSSGATHECGFSLTTGTARELPDAVQWTELTSSHQGPCEVWCDDTLAFSDENCAANYPGNPGVLPYDASKCSGASMLTSYWLALHTAEWQVYTNCAPLSGGSGGSTPSTTTAAPSSASATPTVTTAAPTAPSSAPAATTSAPATTTAAPSPSSSYEDDCDELDVAGSDEDDCDDLDVAGSDADDEVAGEANIEDDCDDLDVAGSDEDDCDDLEVAGTSDLDFSDLDPSYTGGTVESNY